MKEAILIGGLPLAGKTTHAKTKFPDHFLIDDPTLLINDINPHLHKEKIVVADPHLSARYVREIAIRYLEERGFSVKVILMDTPKRVCLRRAIDSGKQSRISYIRIKNLEH